MERKRKGERDEKVQNEGNAAEGIDYKKKFKSVAVPRLLFNSKTVELEEERVEEGRGQDSGECMSERRRKGTSNGG